MQACEWSERWTSLLLTMCTQQRFEVTLLDGEVLYTETSKVCVPVWLALGGIPVTWRLDRVFHCPRITPRAPHYGLSKDTFCCFLKTDKGEELASLFIGDKSTVVTSALR